MLQFLDVVFGAILVLVGLGAAIYFAWRVFLA